MMIKLVSLSRGKTRWIVRKKGQQKRHSVTSRAGFCLPSTSGAVHRTFTLPQNVVLLSCFDLKMNPNFRLALEDVKVHGLSANSADRFRADKL